MKSRHVMRYETISKLPTRSNGIYAHMASSVLLDVLSAKYAFVVLPRPVRIYAISRRRRVLKWSL